MTNVEQSKKSIWFLLMISMLVCTGYYLFFVNRAYVDLDIQVEERTTFKIYWAAAGEGFTEKNHASVQVNPQQGRYHFYLTNLARIERLRIDPHEYKGESVISNITLKQRGFRDIYLNSIDTFGRLTPLMQVEESSLDGNLLKIRSSGKDPAFLYDLHAERVPFGWLGEGVRLVLLFAATFLGGILVAPLLQEYRFVPLLLGVAVALTVVMAATSKRNAHPDEYVHIDAAQYYTDNWLPPQVEDEKIRHTYSHYGFSRLNNHEVYYLFAGKFGKIISEMKVEDYKSFRMFNVLLLLTILFVTIKFGEARLVAVPFLLSPQIWYVFSYCNSDAFGLFMAFIAGWQLIGSKTLLKRFLTGERGIKIVLYSLILGVFLGLLLLLKKNYYPFIAFISGFLLLYCWKKRHELPLKQIFVRLTAVCLIGCSLFLMRIGADYKVNGLDRNEKIAAMRAELTGPLYNPTTPLDKQYAYLRMKERGVTFDTIIRIHRWAEKTFRSAFGVYGYSTVSASPAFYDLIRWTLLALLVFFSCSLLIRGGWDVRLLYFWTLVLSGALIAASFNHAWSVDFQAQGRYLFPIFSMLGITAAFSVRTLPQRSFSVLVSLIFIQSCYSFIYVGLLGIPSIIL